MALRSSLKFPDPNLVQHYTGIHMDFPQIMMGYLLFLGDLLPVGILGIRFRYCAHSRKKMADTDAGIVEKEQEKELNTSTDSTKHRKFKVILLGMNGVGKTSLYLWIKENKFYEDTTGLTTDEGFTKNIQVKNKEVQMTLYDSATGMEYYDRTLTRDYYRDSCVVLLVYSSDSIDSVTKLVGCISAAQEFAPEAKKFILRNKSDLEDQTVRDPEVSAKFSNVGYDLKNFKQFNTSAVDGRGIDDLLLAIGDAILKKKTLPEAAVNNFDSFKVKPEGDATVTNHDQSSSCC